jgi:retron-type reverse transcriptase
MLQRREEKLLTSSKSWQTKKKSGLRHMPISCANKGAITKGINNNTLDGFSFERVEKIMEKLKDGQYKFTPVRRAYIPKRKDSKKKRPLGVPT